VAVRSGFSDSTPIYDGIPFAKENITVSSSATGIQDHLCRVGGVSTGSETRALVQIRTQGVFFTLHSSTATPTSSDHKATTGEWIQVNVPSKLRMIRSEALDALVTATCYTR
jgi:hypothetical protein